MSVLYIDGFEVDTNADTWYEYTILQTQDQPMVVSMSSTKTRKVKFGDLPLRKLVSICDAHKANSGFHNCLSCPLRSACGTEGLMDTAKRHLDTVVQIPGRDRKERKIRKELEVPQDESVRRLIIHSRMKRKR